jgi:hypothetical protein
VGLLLAAIALAWLILVFFTFRAGEVVDGQWVYSINDLWGYDFETYAAAATRLGNGDSLYQAATLSGPFRPGPYGLYMYSPTLGIALLPVAGMAVVDSSVIWYVAHVVALIAAVALMPVRRTIRILSFVVAAFSLAVVRDVALGNVSVLLLLPMAAAWRWLDQPLGSMAQAIAISIRPMLGILIVWQLLRRQWRAVAWTIGAGLVLVVATLPFVGLDGYIQYLTVLGNLTDVTGVAQNFDLGSTALTLGASEQVAGLVLLSGYALAIGAILLSLRRDPEVGFMVALGASLLLSPLLWDHYLAALLLPAAFLAQRGRPWALALPLLSWLPQPLLPLVVIAATFLPFAARRPVAPDQPGQPGAILPTPADAVTPDSAPA